MKFTSKKSLSFRPNLDSLSLTPNFSWVESAFATGNRFNFNGFSPAHLDVPLGRRSTRPERRLSSALPLLGERAGVRGNAASNKSEGNGTCTMRPFLAITPDIAT
jgi:hypothetical protein